MKNLALAFCSVRPSQLPEYIRDGREEEYLICLNQLKRVIPESYDLLICENTIDSLDDLKNQNLKDLFYDSETDLSGSKNNIGTRNKGRGELLMLKNALNKIDLNKYKNVSYITARRFFTCPYVFEKTESLQKQALVSNPDFFFLNGRYIESEKRGMYNDMFFSMNTDVICDYADYAMSGNDSIGSEQTLYNFINTKGIEYEWLDWLGLIRNNWTDNYQSYDANNFHTC